MKKMIKRLKKKLQEKPMITWGRLAIKSLIFIHLLNCFMIVLLTYNNDEFVVTTLVYLLISNIIVFKCIERLWK